MIVVELPIPNRALHPNARVHYMARHRAAKALRSSACIRAMDACPEPAKWKAATIRADWYFKAKRKRDDDGLTGWLKAARDGLADAGIVADDTAFTMGAHTISIDKNRPRVILTITETTT